MPRRNKNARRVIYTKRMRNPDVEYRIPKKPFRLKNDIYPGILVAEAWPRVKGGERIEF